MEKLNKELCSGVGDNIRDQDLGIFNHGERSPLRDLLIETWVSKIKKVPMHGPGQQEQEGS
jgi:hypothetical protein